MSGGEGGRSSGTHTMGQRNTIQFLNKLSKDSFNGNLPPAPELVRASKKTKCGSYVCRKVTQIFEKLTKRKTVHQETQPLTPIPENEYYYDAAGGHDSRGRVFGMGSTSSLYYAQPPRHSSAGEGSTHTECGGQIVSKVKGSRVA